MRDIRPVRKIDLRPKPKKLTTKEDRWFKLPRKLFSFKKKSKKTTFKRKEQRKFVDSWGIRPELLKKPHKAKPKKEIVKKTVSGKINYKKWGNKFQRKALGFWKGVRDLDQKEKISDKKKEAKKWYQKWWFNFIVVGFFVGLTVLLTYPLIKYFTVGIPGDGGDGGMFLWDMWWVKHAVLDLQQDPFYTDLIAAPHKVDLTFHTLALSNSLISIPFQFLFGIVAAFNLVFMGGFVLAGWGTYLLIRYLTKSILAGIVAGVILSFAPYIMVRSLGHFNLATIWPIPFFILFLMKMFYGKRWYPAILAGIFGGILCLNSLQYAVMFALFVGLIYLFYLIAEPKRFLVSTFLVKSALMLVVLLLVFSPLLFPALANYQYNQLEKISLERYIAYSADLVRFIVPSHLSTFFGDYADNVDSRGGIGGTVFLGYTTLFLSIIAILFAVLHFQIKKHKKKQSDNGKMRIWPWLATGFVFFVLSLGPFLHFMGAKKFEVSGIKFMIALPFLAVYKLPFLGDLRVPSRFSIFVMISLTIVAGIGLAYLLKTLGKIKWKSLKYSLIGVVFVAFLGAVLVEFISIPFPTRNVEVPSVYEEIKNDEGDFVVLDLPCGWSTGYFGFGKPSGIVQSYQREHGKKLVNGFISRFPRSRVERYLTMPGLRRLTNYWKPVSVKEDYDRDLINQEFGKLNIKYIILHKKYFKPEERERLKIYLTYIVDAEKFHEDDDVIAYRMKSYHLPETSMQ